MPVAEGQRLHLSAARSPRPILVDSLTMQLLAREGEIDLREDHQVLIPMTPSLSACARVVMCLLRGHGYSLVANDDQQRIGRESYLVAFLNRWLYKHSVRVLVNSPKMAEMFKQRTAGLDIPVVVFARPVDRSIRADCTAVSGRQNRIA